MARVNHKKVKQLLNEKRSRISDRQFFTSRILALHFEDMAMAQTRRYKYNRRIHVSLSWEPKGQSIAYTNNLTIHINTGSRMVTVNRSREARYEIVCGLFAHELGHCLYTDFPTSQTYANFLQAYKWYPTPPKLKTSSDILNEKELWEYVKADPKNLEMLQYVAHEIFNYLEDGYVESRILSRFPGKLGNCLETVRQQQWESMPTVSQLIEEEDYGRHIFESILQIILSYVKFGEIKYGEEPLSDERIQTVFGLLREIDSAIINPSAKDRWSVVNTILVRCWDYIQHYIELCKIRQNEEETSGHTVTLAQLLDKRLGSISGGSGKGTGFSTPVPDPAPSVPASEPAKRTQTMAEAKENASGEDETEASASPKPEEGQEDAGAGDAAGKTQGGTTPIHSDGGGGASQKQDVSAEETGRIPYTQTERVSEPLGGEVTRDDAYERERYHGAASDIERLLDKMAERAACECLENERLRELNDAAQGISYGDIHAGVSIHIRRITEVDEDLVEQYDAISAPLLTISRQLQKSLVQQLKDKQRGGKQTGLMMGRRLDAHALCRNDGKVFYKNALPNEIPEMAVGLLLDESGSMSSADRCTYARASAIILYDFCQSLHIPVMVYGHSTGENAVELFSYAEFEAIDQNDKYRLMDISARASNRDGAALRYVAEQLSKRPEEVKILILVSDGQPADSGYYGSAAEEDLRGIKQEYRRKGILLIAAAIGDDKLSIERIYGDSFMDITDLNQLPVKLTAALKRYLRA